MIKNIQIAREETRCCHMGYFFRLAARVDNTYHNLYYTSRGALAGSNYFGDFSNKLNVHKQLNQPTRSLIHLMTLVENVLITAFVTLDQLVITVPFVVKLW